jgi:hypothetical protein
LDWNIQRLVDNQHATILIDVLLVASAAFCNLPLFDHADRESTSTKVAFNA